MTFRNSHVILGDMSEVRWFMSITRRVQRTAKVPIARMKTKYIAGKILQIQHKIEPDFEVFKKIFF